MAVTALNDEIDLNDEGLVNVYFGSIVGPGNFPSAAFSCQQPLAKFGSSIEAGDINNDGLSDYVIGAPNYDAAVSDAGAVFIFMGNEDSCNLLSGASAIGDINEIHITCDVVSEPELIAFRYRLLGDSTWNYGYSTTLIFTIAALTDCSIYEIGIQAVCLSGSGEWFEFIASTTGCAEDCSFYSIPVISVYGISSTSALVTWSLIPDIIDYTILYKKSGAATWNEVNVTGTSTTISSLDSCSTYEFAIKTNCVIDGPMSGIVTHTTSICAEPCDTAPTGVFADGITSTSALINWEAVFGASQYKVYYRPIGGAWSNSNSLTTSKNLTGLLPLTTYQCKVRASCPGLSSPFSAPITFTTPAKTGDSDASISLYPNPNNGKFILVLPDILDNQIFISIMNVNSELVYSENYKVQNNSINFNIDLAPGIYQLQYINNNISGATKLIIIQ